MEKIMDRLKGSFAVAFATFQDDGELDYESFEKQIDYLSHTGAEGVVLYGMTSEYHKLSDQERFTLAEVFVKRIKQYPHLVSVLSVTDWSTEVAEKTAKRFENLGVDMLMLMPPFYYSPSLDDIRVHMRRILEAVKIPVIIQYAPLATKLYMEPEELVEMSETYPNAAFKIEYRPAREFLWSFLKLKKDMPIMTGWAGLEIIDLYEIGVRGVITVGGFSELYARIFRLLSEKKTEEARALYDRLELYISGWMIDPESLLVIEKEILRRRGILKNSVCRHPAYRMTEENQEEITRFLAEFNEELETDMGREKGDMQL